MIPTCRRASLLLVALLLVLAMAPAALGHTELVSSAPADGATVDEPLDQVELTFGEALMEGGDHAVGVYAPDGETRVDRDDLGSPTPETLAVSVGPLEETGAYEVRWVIVAADGDEQRGAFTFEVAEGALAGPDEGTTPTSESTEDVPAAKADDATTSDAPDDAGTDDGPEVTSNDPADETAAAAAADTAGTGGDDGGAPVLVVVLVVALLAAVGLVVARRRGTPRG